MLDRRRPVSPTSKSLLFCLHAGFDARPLPKPFAIPKRQHPRRRPKTGQPNAVTLTMSLDQTTTCGEGACSRWTAQQAQKRGVASRPSGSKLPRHRFCVFLAEPHCPTPGHNGCRFGITGKRFLPQDSLAHRSNSAGHRTIKIPKRRKISACSSLVSLSNGGSRS